MLLEFTRRHDAYDSADKLALRKKRPFYVYYIEQNSKMIHMVTEIERARKADYVAMPKEKVK